jgi:signal transduction histidine kinase
MLEVFRTAQPFREAAEFFGGGGELGERMRELQWTRTPLGSPAQWPEPLRNAVRTMLASRQPMSLWWGDEHTHLYNDACRGLLGPKHPSALGMKAAVVWEECWDELEARADAALRRHEGSSTPPLRFIVESHGRALESYFAMSGHPVPGERGGFGGVLWTFADVTAAVLREREMTCIDALRRALPGAADAWDACMRACRAIGGNSHDVPFAAFYAIDPNRGEARLMARSGAGAASETLPEAMMLGDACAWPLPAAHDERVLRRVRLDDPRFGRLPQGPWDRAPREALIVPVASMDGGAALVMLAALNPYREFDPAFERFVEMARDQVAAAIASLRLARASSDLDDARSRAEALERSERELRELDGRKTEFLATLAHELRNPLAPLRNGLEVIRLSGSDPAKIDKARGMMQRQLQQMVRLVDDLLDVSRVSRGKVELRLADVELASVLRTAIEASQPLMGERGHSLMARVPAERIVVHGDATRLSQVFWNLLNNAAKYTEAGGRVELDASFADGCVQVRVKDNGIGIPPEMHAHVFEVFTQVDRSLERAQGGLGIGLSIAKRLVEMHGGTIEVKSEGHRKGSEFTVRLPARVEAPVRSAEHEAARQPANLGKRILIADDNADSLETLQIMLEVMGNEVRVARDGEEAVKVAEAFRPDVILLDIGMPNLNGYDACARIRESGAGTRPLIVALTGWSQEEDKQRARAAGFDRHLVKPVEPRTLESLIATLQ